MNRRPLFAILLDLCALVAAALLFGAAWAETLAGVQAAAPNAAPPSTAAVPR